MNETREKVLRHTATIPDREKRLLSGRMVLVILFAALVTAVLISFCLGRYPVGLNELQGILRYWLGVTPSYCLNTRLKVAMESNPARSASKMEKSMMICPSGSIGSICFRPP